jgi:hypothetical protein
MYASPRRRSPLTSVRRDVVDTGRGSTGSSGSVEGSSSGPSWRRVFADTPPLWLGNQYARLGSLQAGSASGHSAARARRQTSLHRAAGTGATSGMTTRQRGA